ncbi:gastrula zinc finger protein XlCGF48.2 isoform X2 [Folsomia candida]|uniref:gastrula zinc finger protein XlCGF48.2 isoform X2 n=1 Tax=Folsomia candida TaxID=158441 RepID=UPI0016055C37|nr:gastrula zinc finger protein XlCGF48.2 isoform X2 [Folsomia candida]
MSMCLLCLQIIEKATKPRKKIRIETVFKLLTVCHHNSKFSTPEFEGDEMCDFCNDCYPFFIKMEEIKRQIALLEGEILTKILDTSSSSSQPRITGREKILQIRDMLLELTGQNVEHYGTNVGAGNLVPDDDEVQVKVEEEDRGDLGDDLGDQLFYDHDYSDREPRIVKSEQDLDNAETDFCIIPTPQTNLTQRKENPKCTTKRKRESETSTERDKLQPKSRPIPDVPAPIGSCVIPSPPMNLTKGKQIPKRTTKRKREDSPTRTISEGDKPQSDPQSPLINKQSGPPSGVGSLIASPKTSNPTSYSGKSTPTNLTPSSSTVHKCPVCPKLFTNESALTSHATYCYPIPCLAPSCSAIFGSRKARDAHVKTTHEGLASFQCRICKTKHWQLYDLATHMVMRHENGEKKLACGKCDKRFCLEENLARHVNLHEVEGAKPFVCDLCDNRFESETRLKTHLASAMHSNPFNCTECKQWFKTRVKLESHLRSHTKPRTEQCPHCDYKAEKKYILSVHVARVHPSGPARQICHICGKGFHHHVDLKNHLARHRQNDEKFKNVECDTHMHGQDAILCEECGTTLTNPEELETHKKVHTVEKRHKCLWGWFSQHDESQDPHKKSRGCGPISLPPLRSDFQIEGEEELACQA